MIDGSEKRNRQLAFEFRIRMFVKSAVKNIFVTSVGANYITMDELPSLKEIAQM